MAGRGFDQSVNSPMTWVKSHLECPVCFNIPRDLPIPCCPSGHIVCRPCKKRVTDCPTCRQPMPESMTNSLAGALIEQVQHKCKYSDHGCVVKMMLKDLQAHEKNCPERTIQCPYHICDSIVALKDFNEHAFNSRHSKQGTTNAMRFAITKNEMYVTGPWPMFCVQTHCVLFHVHFFHFIPQKCFALSVWSSTAEVAKYRANLKLTGDDREMSLSGLLITSVEKVPSNNSCMEENGEYFWCIPLTLAKKLSVGNYEKRRLCFELDVIQKTVKV